NDMMMITSDRINSGSGSAAFRLPVVFFGLPTFPLVPFFAVVFDVVFFFVVSGTILPPFIHW
ncbi:hypothetical protein CLOSTHATH_07603, partial [Hungatella hathewayi DSM 13479]